MLPGCFIPKDLGHTSYFPKPCSLGCALQFGGILQEGLSKGVLLFQARGRVQDGLPSSPVFVSPHPERLAAQWREACQQSSHRVYGASCFLDIQFPHLLFGIFLELTLISLSS